MNYPLFLTAGDGQTIEADIILSQLDEYAYSANGIRHFRVLLVAGVIDTLESIGYVNYSSDVGTFLPFSRELFENIRFKDVRFIADAFDIPNEDHFLFLLRQYFLINYYAHHSVRNNSYDDPEYHPDKIRNNVLEILRESGIENALIPRIFFLCACAYNSCDELYLNQLMRRNITSLASTERRQAKKVEKLLNQFDKLIEDGRGKNELTGVLGIVQAELTAIRKKIDTHLEIYVQAEDSFTGLPRLAGSLPEVCYQAHEGLARTIEESHSSHWKADDATRILNAFGIRVKKGTVRQYRRRKRKKK